MGEGPSGAARPALAIPEKAGVGIPTHVTCAHCGVAYTSVRNSPSVAGHRAYAHVPTNERTRSDDAAAYREAARFARTVGAKRLRARWSTQSRDPEQRLATCGRSIEYCRSVRHSLTPRQLGWTRPIETSGKRRRSSQTSCA